MSPGERPRAAVRVLAVGQVLVLLLLVGTGFAQLGAPEAPPAEPAAAVAAAPAAPAATSPRAAAECADGSACRPIPVEGPRFEHLGDTRLAADRAIGRYGCDPAVPEGGAEVWYAVTVTRPGVLRAEIDEDPTDGIDVDVHLLPAADPDRCVARGNAEAAASVAPGTWFVVVDTCSLGGREKPGRYHLTVTLP